MKLHFQGGGEIAVLDINRAEKKLRVMSTKSNYQWVDAEWKALGDSGKEEIQIKYLDTLTDAEFQVVITAAMGKQGYKLTKIVNEEEVKEENVAV